MELVPDNDAASSRRAERAADPAPDEVCAMLAREVRSPLATIEGYLDLLAHGGVGPISDEQRDFLDVVIRNVHRLSTVASDWHEMARLEAGRLDLVREPVDLVEIVDRAVADLRPGIRGKEQQVTVDVADTATMAVGDPRALLRVVGNLVSNAHKYTPPGGRIRVVLGVGEDQTVRLDVIDTGIGIRDEDQPHLFRKFFRAHLTDAEPGTGLGLTISRVLVERMGGQVLVRSVLGEGSTFSVVLPSVRVAEACVGEARVVGAVGEAASPGAVD